jgi:AraC family transcriptional regulator
MISSLMPSERELLPLIQAIVRQRDDSRTLAELAAQAGWSPFHLHRAFTQMVGETPKQYSLRLRLERAAGRLVSSDDAVLTIALDAGFASHAVFTRAFRRRFGQPPARYRTSALAGATAKQRATHRALVDTTGPCIGLFHRPDDRPSRSSVMPTLSIVRRELTEQPVFYTRLRPARHELAAAIAKGLHATFPVMQKAGVAMTGAPFTRYLSTGPGLFTIEVGVPTSGTGPGEGDTESGTLRGGPVAMAVHAGHYDQLSETYAAMERWIEEHGYRVDGPPWESYVTDPGDFPDTADWRTEVYWPLAE